MTQTINREAHEGAKGFRLQRLRAAHLMLQRIEASNETHFYSAVEDTEDVSLQNASKEGTEEYYEEDKNYDPSTSFTLNSNPVKNTLVSFLDIFLGKWRSSDKISFGFYTTAEIGKENKKNFEDKYGLTPPESPILKLLQDKDFSDANTVKCVRAVLLDEYQSQYAKSSSKGYVDEIEKMSDSHIRDFLGRIEWFFGTEDEKLLYQAVIEQVRNSSWFNYRTEGKEETICRELLDTFDERQSYKDHAERFVYKSDIQVLFLKAASEAEDGLSDPAWKHWEDIPEPSDSRNLGEKIQAVYPDFDPQALSVLARRASIAQMEAAIGHHSVKAMWCRVLIACERSIGNGAIQRPFTETSDVNAAIEILFECAKEEVEELKGDYQYKLSNPQTLEGVVLNLMDTCFISLDQVPSDGN
ncbi:hypothetical protein QWY84_15955 [Aquisalimonas lutea]|uniref:hypothetical protein n=1 Tax=Aquisalimonas lutea TaxID=1327750 RepID=UPI0025B5CF3D|nr:hypothetical protein [Aquisalimonas lutea]MDN3519110.1 hypothetical protein [Aquisalimonas lutea]